METTKVYQKEMFEFSENEHLVHSGEIETFDNGTNADVTLFGIDGNIIFETQLDKIHDGEYPEWIEEFINGMGIG